MLEACVIWMSPLLKKIKKAAPKMLWGAVSAYGLKYLKIGL